MMKRRRKVTSEMCVSLGLTVLRRQLLLDQEVSILDKTWRGRNLEGKKSWKGRSLEREEVRVSLTSTLDDPSLVSCFVPRWWWSWRMRDSKLDVQKYRSVCLLLETHRELIASLILSFFGSTLSTMLSTQKLCSCCIKFFRFTLFSRFCPVSLYFDPCFLTCYIRLPHQFLSASPSLLVVISVLFFFPASLYCI